MKLLPEHGSYGDPAQGLELKWGKAWSQPEARDQALIVSLGTVPPDSTSSSFPGRSHGDPGEASGAWGHCGLPGSGEQETPTGWEVGGGPSTSGPPLPTDLCQPGRQTGFLWGQAPPPVGCMAWGHPS